MPLFKGYHSLFRYLGFVGAIFTTVQAVICVILACIGIILYYIAPDIGPNSPIGHSFCFLYFSENSAQYENYIDPIFFHIILWLALVIYGVWIYFSVVLLKVYAAWNNNEDIKLVTTRWILITSAVCIFDLLIFSFFCAEFLLIIYDQQLISQMTEEVIRTGNLSHLDIENELLTNEAIINTLLKQKEQYNKKTRSMIEDGPSYINPFVRDQFDDKNDQEEDYFALTTQRNLENNPSIVDIRASFQDESLIVKVNVTSTDPSKIFGVWSWFAAPAAIVMTVIMKTFLGWFTNVIIIFIMHNINSSRDSQVMILNAPKL